MSNDGSRTLPFEERRPGVAIRLVPANAVLGRRDVEHHDVRRVVRQHTVEVAGVHRVGPAEHQLANLLLVVSGHLRSPLILGSVLG